MCGDFHIPADRTARAASIVLYLICLALLGWPILICEYAVGRASRHSTAKAFHVLEPKGTRWHRYRRVQRGGHTWPADDVLHHGLRLR